MFADSGFFTVLLPGTGGIATFAHIFGVHLSVLVSADQLSSWFDFEVLG